VAEHARPLVIAVDPGARGTGLVLRRGDQLLDHTLVERAGRGPLPDAVYLRQVNAAVGRLFHVAAASRPVVAADAIVVAVEDLHAPNPHLGTTNVLGVLGAAMVLGAVLDRWPDALRVPPGGHGAGPLAAYPAVLRGPRERRGTGARRHLRSAWDIAGAAAGVLRVQQQGRPA